jgi:2-succinyl-5-enolpyruvyl-6-hydroxy-3-cyclohexene-1-carboxylate synthase
VNDPNLNALWCRALAEELKRAQVGYVVLCPGSRNSPLLFALHNQFGDACRSHLDERSAGFWALGLIKASGKAVAICVTSGSAVANLAPTLVEADAAELPLIMISADRPWELQQCGAAQTMDQRGLFTPYVRSSLLLGEPTASNETLRALRSQVSRVAQIRSGPTHINVPLRDPLPPLTDPSWVTPNLADDAAHGRVDRQPFTLAVKCDDISALPETPWLSPGMRGIIIAGCSDQRQNLVAVQQCAMLTGFPVIADAASGLRDIETPQLITSGDGLITGPLGQEKAELIIQVGPLPLARSLQDWMGKQTCPWIVIESQRHLDAAARAWLSLQGPPLDNALATLASRCAPGDAAWTARWVTADQRARKWLLHTIPSLPWGEHVATQVAVTYPGFNFLHLASSMSVRYANVHCQPSSRPVFSNRGVNGIDGTIATFLGELDALRTPGLLLIGDVALLHDAASLFIRLPKNQQRHGAIVVLNNDGGGIFDFLPVHQVPHYHTLVRTEHGRDCASVAALGELTYHLVSQASELTTALHAALNTSGAGNGLHLIECRCDPTLAVNQHRAVIERISSP